MKNILIVGSKSSGVKNDPKRIADSLASAAVSIKLVYWEDLVFSVQSGNVTVFSDGKDLFAEPIATCIAVGWYKNGKQSVYRDVAFSLALLLRQKKIDFWNSEMGEQRSTTKLSTMVQLALEDVPVPDTQFSLHFNNIENSIALPAVVKAISASRGASNYLVSTIDELAMINTSEGYFMAQPFLPNDHDLRIICFGGEPKLILKRARTSNDTHLNNTSQGGLAEWIDVASVAPELLTLSRKISKVMYREMAGIDLIPDVLSPFGYSCLEVNAVPQLTSGTDSEIKLNAFRLSL